MFELKELIETGLRKGKKAEDLLTIISANIDDDANKTEMYEDLYKQIHGYHLCDDFCVKFVEAMHNDSGSGKKWTLDQTNEIARKIGVSFDDEYTQYEFWCVMHMMYYNYSDVLNESGMIEPAIFGKMADAYFMVNYFPKGHLVDDFFFIERKV